MKTAISSLLVVVVMFVAGCASVPMAGIEQDAKAKDFSPPEGKASIYIYRNESMGAAIPMGVTVNGISLGRTAAKTYFLVNVPPGSYVVESHAESISRLPLSVAKGKNYFVWQEVKMGMWMAGSLLQLVADEVGQAGVRESKLIASSGAEERIQPMGASGGAQAAAAPATESVDQRLRELKGLNDAGLISREVYLERQRQILEARQ